MEMLGGLSLVPQMEAWKVVSEFSEKASPVVRRKMGP